MLFTNQWYQAGTETVFLGQVGLAPVTQRIPVNPTVLVSDTIVEYTETDMVNAERELKEMFGEDLIILRDRGPVTVEEFINLAAKFAESARQPGKTTLQYGMFMRLMEDVMGNIPESPPPKKPHLRLV